MRQIDPQTQSPKPQFQIHWSDWCILFLLGSIWGSSFILMKIGARSFNTLEISSLRMFFGGVFVLPMFYHTIQKYDRSTILWLLASALLGSGIPILFYAYSASKLDSNINGVINSLTPVFTIIFGVIIFKNKISRMSVLGLLIGFIGIFVLITQRSSDLSQAQFAIFPLMATMMYGVNMNLVKVKISHLPSKDLLIGVFGFLGLIYTPLVFIQGCMTNVDWSSFSIQFWQMSDIIEVQRMRGLTALFILGFVGTLFASFLFFYFIKRTNALFASMNTYLIPLMAIFWGYIDGEPIGLMHLISLILILIGVFLVGKKS